MRLAFILLFAINLGFFAWEYPWAYQGKALYAKYVGIPNHAREVQRVDPGVNPLLLLNEDKVPPLNIGAQPQASPQDHPEPASKDHAGHEQPPVTPAAPVKEAESPVKSVKPETKAKVKAAVKEPAKVESERPCYTIGAFTSLNTANRAAAWLSERGVPVKPRRAQEKEPSGYWVYIPPVKTAAAAGRISDRLRRNKVEHFVMTKGENKNAISLGVFRSEASADKIKASVTAKGFTGVVVERQFRGVDRFWLDVDHSQGKPVPETTMQAFNARFRRAQQEPVACK